MQRDGRVLELGGGPGDGVDLVFSRWHAALGGLVAELAGRGVGLGDGLVDLPLGAADLGAGMRE